MAYCPECGIEVTTQREDCPLCRTKLQANEPTITRAFPVAIQQARPDPYGWIEIRKILFTTLSILPTLGIISVVIVNLMQNGTLNWARYTIVSLVAGWGVLALALFKYRKPLQLLWSVTGVLSVFCFLLALFNGGQCWWLTLALPLLLLFSGLFSVVWWKTVVQRVHWALGTAFILAAVIAFCLGLELIINLYMERSSLPTWSAIICLVLGPPVLFLLYVRYRLSKRVDFGKLFHR